MAEAAYKLVDWATRKPAGAAQYNWVTEDFDVEAEQLELDIPATDEIVLPEDNTVTLLATESGSQLFVSGFGLYVGKKSERVVVRQGKTVVAQAPFMRVQEIILASRGISFSTDFLEEVCARGIRVGVLGSGAKPVALITSPMLTATVETRRAQMLAYGNATGAEFCRWVVAGKLHNQEKLLRYFGKSREGERRESLESSATVLRKLRKQALAVEGDTPDAVRGALMGFEGTGGRIYWQRITDMLPESLGFAGREHRGATDGVNSALNYGYAILYAHVWGAVMNAGLEPFAGFLHTDKSGKPSLVLDLVEEFRQPVVDRAILTWLNKGGRLTFEKGMLDGESKEAVASRVLLRLNATERHRGKEHEIRSIVQMQARLAASALRGQRAYRPFTFKW